MAASVMPAHTWTNDTGTAANPNGDGTLVANADLQTLIGKINQMFGGGAGYDPFVFGGAIATEKSGDAAGFTGAPTGSQSVFIRNTAAGTGNMTQLIMGNDTTAISARLRVTASNFTATGGYLQNAGHLMSALAGGLKLFCDHAAGFVLLGSRVAFDVARPASVGSNQTDYALTPDASIYYLTTSVGGVRFDGFTGGVDGRVVWIVNNNVIGGNTITVGYEAGTAANRVVNAAAADIAMNPKSIMPMLYDGTNSRWIAGAKS